jgi:hypothetical protein
LPVFRRQAATTAGAVLLGKTQLQMDRPLIPRPYRNFHSFLSPSSLASWSSVLFPQLSTCTGTVVIRTEETAYLAG